MAAHPTPEPKPHERLVRVFDTEQESEAMVVKALLESAGMDSKISGIDTVQDVLPIGGSIILVREEDEAAARQLLAEYRRSPAEEAAEEEDFDATAETANAQGQADEDSQAGE